ncbi:MAG: methyltransferase domain-containing protein, partial [Acidobacteria bacterium]|nr:methyltransferase domain-containing protein [Acidobacteriota bacterium]
MARRVCVALLLVVLGIYAGATLAGHAQQQEQHRRLHREADPTKQSFADVERFRALFESSERDAWQKPFEVIRALGVQPGATVADIGAGTGYFARRWAVAVGREGTVFAADFEPNMVVELRASAERDGLANLIPVLASADDPRLPDGTADLIFICVPTPYQAGTGFDASALEDAFGRIDGSKVIVIKSTVLPGTTESFQVRYPQHRFLFNPEFLRQDYARAEFLKPDRQIVGYCAESRHLAESVLSLLPDAPYRRVMLAKEAELTKYMAN